LHEPKPVYHLSSDFLLLSARLDFLQTHVLQAKPKTLARLWRDKRNTHQWYTFWAVIFYGTVGSLFSLVQIALAAAQLHY